MKLVNEHIIFEKFQEDSDPIHDMGIGLFRPRNFDSKKDLHDFLAKNIEGIFKVQKLPTAFMALAKTGGAVSIKSANLDHLERFVSKYISINNWKVKGHETISSFELADKLAALNKGIIYVSKEDWDNNKVKLDAALVKLRKKSTRRVHEAFSEDSDAIKDMGIGMQKEIEKFKKWVNNDRGLNVFEDDNIERLLSWGAFFNRFDIVDYAIDNGADINHRHGTPLHYAACAFNTEMGVHLVERGADFMMAQAGVKAGSLSSDTEAGMTKIANALNKKVNEKFEEVSDPITDLGIGTFVKRDFNDLQKFKDFLVQHLPNILNMDKIPFDILYRAGGVMNQHWYNVIARYLKKYVSYDGISIDKPSNKVYWWPEMLKNELEKIGFKSKLDKDYGLEYRDANEAFKSESDPIHDLGIGVIPKFIKQLKKDANDEEDIEYAYEQTIRKFNYRYPGIDWQKIFDELSEDALNEKFKADSDPVRDLGIGVTRVYYYFYISGWAENIPIDFNNPNHIALLKWLQNNKSTNYFYANELQKCRRLCRKARIIQKSPDGKVYTPEMNKNSGPDITLRVASVNDPDHLFDKGVYQEWVWNFHDVSLNTEDHYKPWSEVKGKIKENVNERLGFTEDGDPIRDMGIGVQAHWDRLRGGDVFMITNDLPNLDKYAGQYVYVIEASKYAQKSPGGAENCKGVNYKIYKTKKALLADKKKRTHWKEGDKIWYWPFNFFKEFLRKVDKEELKESYMGFTDDSDPIADMGIGEADKFEKALYDFILKGFDGFYSNLNEIIAKGSAITIGWDHDPYEDNFKYQVKSSLISSGFDKYVNGIDAVSKRKKSTFSDEVAIPIKQEYWYILDGIESIEKKRINTKMHFKDRNGHTYEIKINWK